jgi:putative ABC transport system permease protein
MGTATEIAVPAAPPSPPMPGRSSLSWSSAAKIAVRELRNSRAKFAFVILSVAIGVAALIGVRGFSESFQKTLLTEARTIMSADLSARMFRQPSDDEEKQLSAMAAGGVERTTVTEMVSMASTPGDPVPLLIALKAIDPAVYPLYGHVDLRLASGAASTDLKSALTETSVVVGDDLLIRLKRQIGDMLKVGNQQYLIAAVVVREPDRMSSQMGLGPRVLISRAGLDRSGLLQRGSRSGERMLFKLSSQKDDITKARARLEKILPDAQVTDFRETSPALTEGLNRATGLLSLICLVAMVLGAIGVAMAMRAHLQQRIEILAIMKSIGARSSDILRIYLFQTLLLGLLGGLLGVVLGLGVEWVFPLVLGKLLPMRPPLHLPLRSALAGLGTGVLTTLLFCLPPLLDIRKVRPSLVLRRQVEESGSEDGSRWSRFQLKARENRVQWLAIVLIVAALAGIATGLSDSWVVGRSFAIGISVALLVTLGLSALLLRVLRAFLARTRLSLPASIRHALANLYRPGNQSSAVLAALGLGVMLILAVFLVQRGVVRAMQADADPSTPNVFLVDMTTQELPGIKTLIARQPGVRGKLETLPVVSGRIASVDGVATDKLKVKNYPKRLLQSITLTWSDDIPAGSKLVSGKWWSAPNQATSHQDFPTRASHEEAGFPLAVEDRAADRLRLHVGSQVVFDAGEKNITTKVGAIYKSDGQHVYARNEFILPSNALRDLPVIWYGAAHIDIAQVAAMQRALFAAYPTVTVINIADILETIEGFVGQITIVVRFLAGFSMLSGAVILASSVASTRFRRIREVVVLKTLGATRPYIARIFSVEFFVLGLLAGLVGTVFANLLARVLMHSLEVPFHMEWVAAIVAVLGTAALAIATGWIASFRILGQKPLEILREQ